MKYSGELAALTTAFLWSFTSIFFTLASRRIGSYYLNKFRIPAAAIFLALMLIFSSGHLFPAKLSSSACYYLIISGIIGLSLGDLCLFSAFLILGTRLTLLIFATSPIIAALTAWILLGERLGYYAVIGIVITMTGVAWVTLEQQKNGIKSEPAGSKSKKLGIILALCAAAGQAIGLVLAKAGMGEDVAPLEATFIRMLAATAAVWIYGLFRGDTFKSLKVLKDKKSLLLLLGGSICGPFLGVWMSLIAVKQTEAGIAAAIMSIVPVTVIPLVIIVYKESVSPRAIFGAIMAVIGVALLFLL